MFMTDDIVFTKIKYNVSEKMKSKYPNLSFTTDNRLRKTTDFPTIWWYYLGNPDPVYSSQKGEIIQTGTKFSIDPL